MLKLEHIKKSYDGVNILNDINLEIADGEIVSILGRQKYMVVSRLMGDGALQTFYITVFQQGKCGCDDDAHSIHRQYSVPELSGKIQHPLQQNFPDGTEKEPHKRYSFRRIEYCFMCDGAFDFAVIFLIPFVSDWPYQSISHLLPPHGFSFRGWFPGTGRMAQKMY